jgi:hypothetical protein
MCNAGGNDDLRRPWHAQGRTSSMAARALKPDARVWRRSLTAPTLAAVSSGHNHRACCSRRQPEGQTVVDVCANSMSSTSSSGESSSTGSSIFNSLSCEPFLFLPHSSASLVFRNSSTPSTASRRRQLLMQSVWSVLYANPNSISCAQTESCVGI